MTQTKIVTKKSVFEWNQLLVLSLWFVPAAVVTWGIHEFAHYATGILLGYDMWITFNHAGPVQGHFDADFHEVAVAMAGPVVTWVQAVVVLQWIRNSRKQFLYPLLFLTLWSRALAAIFSFISHPNDEAKASVLVGLPMWVLPALSVGLMFATTFYGSRILKMGWKGNTVSYIAASIVTAAIVFSDEWLF